jgi:hypothetical protein
MNPLFDAARELLDFLDSLHFPSVDVFVAGLKSSPG